MIPLPGESLGWRSVVGFRRSWLVLDAAGAAVLSYYLMIFSPNQSSSQRSSIIARRRCAARQVQGGAQRNRAGGDPGLCNVIIPRMMLPARLSIFSSGRKLEGPKLHKVAGFERAPSKEDEVGQHGLRARACVVVPATIPP
jgi:hypothetical protein